MNQLQLFLPCAGGVEPLLADEVRRTVDSAATDSVQPVRGGVLLQGSWRDAMALNLHSRLAQRVLIQLSRTPYAQERDLYNAAANVAWELWFTPKQSFKIDITAQKSPLKSLNFAALTIKDALVDRFRNKFGMRPNVETTWPDVRVFAHLTNDRLALYIDTSGEPLFKRGWREDKGDAPLKETLAAAMLAASGWTPDQPLYDPCCGSGTIVIEAAQMALNIAPGSLRRFGFEKLLPFQPHVWQAMKKQAADAVKRPARGQTSGASPANSQGGPSGTDQGAEVAVQIFGSDVAHRMVDFAQRNAERAGVAHAVQLRGGDALQRMPPVAAPPQGAKMVFNPPYGERIEVRGVAAQRLAGGRDADRGGNGGGSGGFGARQGMAQGMPPGQRNVWRAPERDTGPALALAKTREAFEDGQSANAFFEKLAAHWKKQFHGWSAHVLTPDMKLPTRMRLKESARVPMWNGPLECRLFRFDIVAGSARTADREPRHG